MAEKAYSPMASYKELKRVEDLMDSAKTVAELRKIVTTDGPKVGYKAFCYMLGGKMTAEAMKPDEACVAAATFELEGKTAEATEIYKKVLAVHPSHPIAKSKLS